MPALVLWGSTVLRCLQSGLHLCEQLVDGPGFIALHILSHFIFLSPKGGHHRFIDGRLRGAKMLVWRHRAGLDPGPSPPRLLTPRQNITNQTRMLATPLALLQVSTLPLVGSVTYEL